jgi:hypothetical protein
MNIVIDKSQSLKPTYTTHTKTKTFFCHCHHCSKLITMSLLGIKMTSIHIPLSKSLMSILLLWNTGTLNQLCLYRSDQSSPWLIFFSPSSKIMQCHSYTTQSAIPLNYSIFWGLVNETSIVGCNSIEMLVIHHFCDTIITFAKSPVSIIIAWHPYVATYSQP